jgi:hypothetical protein
MSKDAMTPEEVAFRDKVFISLFEKHPKEFLDENIEASIAKMFQEANKVVLARRQNTEDILTTVEFFRTGGMNDDLIQQAYATYKGVRKFTKPGKTPILLAGLKALTVEALRQDLLGGDGFECAEFSKQEWKNCVTLNITDLGYWEWVVKKAREEQIELDDLNERRLAKEEA